MNVRNPGGFCRVLVRHTSTFWWRLQTLFYYSILSYSTVKSHDWMASALTALEIEVTSRDVQREESLSASGKHPLFRSCEATAFADTAQTECVVSLTVSLFMVCHAL